MTLTSDTYRKRRTGRAIYKTPGYPDEVYVSTRDIVYTNTVSKGGPVKDYKRKIARGYDATTELVGTKYRIRKYKPVTSVIERTNGGLVACVGYPTAGARSGFVNGTLLALPDAHREAEQNFATSYRKATQRANGGAFLVEIAETAALLANPVKGMYTLTHEFAKALKRGRMLHPSRYRRFLSDTWLTYVFGMKPLASDANDYCTALASLASGRNFELVRLKGTGEASAVLSGPTDYGTNMISGGAPWLQDQTVLRKSSVVIRGAIRVSGEIPPATQFGISALDIVPSIWEGIPFSFLLDYFTNIGDTLDTAMLRFVDFAWLNQTDINLTINKIGNARPLPLTPGQLRRYAYGGEAEFVTRNVYRRSRTNNFGGSFHFKAPNLGSVKWLNIAALASSFLGSKPPVKIPQFNL